MKLWRVDLLIAAALLALIVGVGVVLDRRARDRGHEAKGAERVVISERHTADTVYRRQVDTLTRVARRVDTLRTRLVLTDTVAVKEYVAASDTALRVCRAVVTTCERRVMLADSLAALRLVQLRAAQRAPRVEKWAGAAYDFGAQAWQGDAGVGLRLVGSLSATAAVQLSTAPGEKPKYLVGARVRF